MGFSLLIGSSRAGSYSHVAASFGQCPLNIPAGLQLPAQLECPRPIADSTAYGPIDWSPWTHPPDCLQADKSPATKYCVFSNSQFGNQGISIVTTPETAANGIEILSDPGYTITKSLANGQAGTAYEVVELPGKGKGVVAIRHISRAEVIMVDWALLMVDLDFPVSVNRSRGYKLLHKAADQLSDPDRLLQLARSSAFSADIVEDLLRTNAFSYNFAGKPREERRTALQKWGFNCTCSLCTASKTEIAASDYRRAKMKALREEVMKAVEAWDGTKAVKLTHEVLELMHAEELAPLYAGQYEIMARLYWKAKDTKTATKYAQMSLDTLVDQGYLEESLKALPALLKSFNS
ncbi:hypothetical protein AAE478_009588 [Parahypoxylon ruwenzoriense]